LDFAEVLLPPFILAQRQRPNGWRYRQGRDLAGKATRRRIRRLGLNPESVGECPHLSGARGVSPLSWNLDDDFIEKMDFLFEKLSIFSQLVKMRLES
jgi:hypothetical protein